MLQLEKYLIQIKQSGIPTLWAFSENDRLVEKEIFYEMVDIMGAKESNFQKYDSNGKTESKCKSIVYSVLCLTSFNFSM